MPDFNELRCGVSKLAGNLALRVASEGTAVRAIVATSAVVGCGTPHNVGYPPVKLADHEMRLAT